MGRSQPSSHGYPLVSRSLPVGHGQSEGERMVVSDFHVFVRDALQHVDVMQKDHPGLPVFLLGHSMVSRPQTMRSRSGCGLGSVRTQDGEGAALTPYLIPAPRLAGTPHSALGVPRQFSAQETGQVQSPGDSPESSEWPVPSHQGPRHREVAHSPYRGARCGALTFG